MRRSLAALAIGVLLVASGLALRWIWRDIAYWSRSVTFTYQTDSLDTCARLVALDWPGVSASTMGDAIALRIPGQEGALVKPTSEPHEARLVVFGHSASISRLGPASEQSVQELLARFTREAARWCSG